MSSSEISGLEPGHTDTIKGPDGVFRETTKGMQELPESRPVYDLFENGRGTTSHEESESSE